MAELKFLNVETCKLIRSQDPGVNVNGKSGTVRLNKSACEKLGISETNSLQIVMDGKFTYMLIDFEGGFQLRRGKEKDAGVLILQNTPCARGIFKNFDIDEHSNYRFKISDKKDLKGLEVFELRKQSVLD